jgi:hypothetical protein
MRLASAVLSVTVAASCGPYHRRPEFNPAPLPIDLTYVAAEQLVTLEVDADRVVQYSFGGNTLSGKVPQSKIDQLVAHIESRAFRELLQAARRNSGAGEIVSEGTLQLYRRGFGVACGPSATGGWRSQQIHGYPPYVVSTDAGSLAPLVSTLIALANDIGHTAFAGEFHSIEVAAVGSEPDTRALPAR